MTGSSTVNCSFLRFKQLRNMNPKPPQPQKGSLVNLSDAVYATSTMDLRLRYFSQSPRVPLHPIQYSLVEGAGIVPKPFLTSLYSDSVATLRGGVFSR
jgi:hypothetical protein